MQSTICHGKNLMLILFYIQMVCILNISLKLIQLTIHKIIFKYLCFNIHLSKCLDNYDAVEKFMKNILNKSLHQTIQQQKLLREIII